MEKLILEKPTLKRKEDAYFYVNEFNEYKSSFNGTGNLENYSYKKWLSVLEEKYNRNN